MGLMTGALVVGLVFFYKAMSPMDYGSSLFRSYTPVVSTDLYSGLNTVKTYDSGSFNLVAPVPSIGTIDTRSIGTPEGN